MSRNSVSQKRLDNYPGKQAGRLFNSGETDAVDAALNWLVAALEGGKRHPLAAGGLNFEQA